MSMIVKKTGKDFEPCPEYTGRAVCVDVTPLKKVQSAYGEREVFRFVFEIDLEKEDGGRWCVWSSGFTPTLSEKSNLTKFLRQWRGRSMDANEEQNGFDVETMLGAPAFIVVTHNVKEGTTYANIESCTPLRGEEPLTPCGKYVRAVNREDKGANGAGGKDATYRRTAPQPKPVPVDSGASDDADSYLTTKVHVGRFRGCELREVSEDGLRKLCELWLPAALTATKPTADDRRLMAALEAWQRKDTGSAVPVPADGEEAF